MLYGMAEPIKAAVLRMGCRLREYCPVGELLPGMAYFVRRLLENTSNEGFLANKFAKGASREELLQDPRRCLPCGHALARPPPERRRRSGSQAFRNEPPTDFTTPHAREGCSAAIGDLRAKAGPAPPAHHQQQAGRDARLAALIEPGQPEEVIGYAAQRHCRRRRGRARRRARRAAAMGRRPAAERAAILEQAARAHAPRQSRPLRPGNSGGRQELDRGRRRRGGGDRFLQFLCRSDARAWPGPSARKLVAGESNFQHWRPRGVGVVIAPWNFPLAILTGMAAAAVVAGNAVVIKPSDQTPVIAARLDGLCSWRRGCPPGVVNLLTGPGAGSAPTWSPTRRSISSPSPARRKWA